METASLARLAFHPYLALHDPHELRRDRQPQPRAAILSRRGTVGLCERLKDEMSLLPGNSNARVSYLEMKHRLVALPTLHAHFQADFTPGGEFDGVAQQVDNDLPETCWIP